MSGPLRFLLFLVVALAILAVVLVQIVLPAVVTAAVRASLGSLASPVSVQVQTSVAGVLLHGRIDAISIRGGPIQRGDVGASDLQLTATDVTIVDRSIGGLDGTLHGVRVQVGDGETFQVDTVQVSGTLDQIRLTGDVAPSDLAADVQLALQQAVSNPLAATARVAIDGGSIHVVAGSANVAATLRVDHGSLVLDGGPLGTVAILTAPADGSWRLTGATLSAAGMRFTAMLGPSVIAGLV